MTRIGRVCLLALAALLYGTLLAAIADAEQRAWTCAPESGAYSDAHCVNNVAGAFKAVEIANGTMTETTVTNAKTASGTTAAQPAILSGTIAGIVTAIQCNEVGGQGWIINASTSVSGAGVFELKGCTVTKPAGRECKVSGGAITSETVTATTAGQAGFKLKFEGSGETRKFTSIVLENCKENKPPNAVYPITGSLVDSVSGATTTITLAASKEQATLLFGGNAAGIEGALTGSMKAGNPIFLK